MSHGTPKLEFARERVEALLELLQRMAAGERTHLPLSPAHDELDAIAHAVNVLADELHWTNARIADAERQRATELQRGKEHAERASEGKSIFLRTASHEIRTPIAVILGIADQLAYSGLSEDDQALVDRLRANGRALLSLVGNVLDLSRLDADKIPLTIERVSPLELTLEVVKSIEAEARRKALAVRVESDVSPSLTIETDRVRLRQILVNVVANAVKFTARGQIVVALRAQMSDGATPRLTVDVSDSGIGIDDEHRQYLFEPFGQAHSSIERVHGGTGLGLALSSRLAERLGGNLELQWSEPGKGSTFRLTLAPTAAGGAQTFERIAAERATSPRRSLEGVRVLLADDHPDLRLVIGRSLEKDGASVTYTHDGGRAVELVKTGEFDVVLMDILMPTVSGLQATRTLRAEGWRVPVIAISADASPEMRATAIDAGCDAHLAKPFDPGDLAALVQLVRSGSHTAIADSAPG